MPFLPGLKWDASVSTVCARLEQLNGISESILVYDRIVVVKRKDTHKRSVNHCWGEAGLVSVEFALRSVRLYRTSVFWVEYTTVEVTKPMVQRVAGNHCGVVVIHGMSGYFDFFQSMAWGMYLSDKSIKYCCPRLVVSFYYRLRRFRPSVNWKLRYIVGKQRDNQEDCRNRCSQFVQRLVEGVDDISNYYSVFEMKKY